MASHESGINFKNLIHDLAEMYPFEISEVIVIELVANSLDAGATSISIDYDEKTRILTVEDNGNGMSRQQFDEYHDFAAGLKTKGTGIGFAGLGAKLSFNVADKVITQTKSKTLAAGSNWHLASKKKLVWEDITPTHISNHGTRVEVHFRKEGVPAYSTTDDLLAILRRHYLPLLDKEFLELYDQLDIYSKGLRFTINGKNIEPTQVRTSPCLEGVSEFYPKRGKKIIGRGFFGMMSSDYAILPNICGVLLCTYGKVIKSDFFNQFPGSSGPKIFGIVESPRFVKFLTTAKTDFTRRGSYREFEKIYGPVREEFVSWLKKMGLESSQPESGDEALKIERELKKILLDIPELSEFFGFRTKKPVLVENVKGSTATETTEGIETTFPFGTGNKGVTHAPVDAGEEPGQMPSPDDDGSKRADPISRTARRGPKIAFETQPERGDLAWVSGHKIIINKGHPSYMKAKSNNIALRIHHLFSIAGAIQKFLGAETEQPDFAFIDRMMAAWGKK